MSDVKRWRIAIDTPILEVGQTSPVPTICVIKELDHDRVVAEKDFEIRYAVDQWDAFVEKTIAQRETIAAKDAKIAEKNADIVTFIDDLDTARKTIATQKRVIEKLREQRNDYFDSYNEERGVDSNQAIELKAKLDEAIAKEGAE